MQGIFALIGGILAAYEVGRNLEINPHPSVIRAGVLDGNDLGNSIFVACARKQGLVRHEVFQTVRALLLLDQVDFYVSDCKCVGGFISIGEVRQGGAADGHDSQRHAQAQRYDFLLHVQFLFPVNDVFMSPGVRLHTGVNL